jgi:hypothetical protein
MLAQSQVIERPAFASSAPALRYIPRIWNTNEAPDLSAIISVKKALTPGRGWIETPIRRYCASISEKTPTTMVPVWAIFSAIHGFDPY